MEAPLTAKIVSWDEPNGYGFLLTGNRKVFLHRRDFVEHHKRPAVGDTIQFTIGQDAKGRSCAINAVHLRDGGRITMTAFLFLTCLIVLPVTALLRHGADWRWLGAAGLMMSVLSYASYAVDKQRAKKNAWRLTERGLLLLDLLGGWPGGFLAQRRLRHKCSKPGFQFYFWFIVLAYQFAAFDSLQHWQISRAAWNGVIHPAEKQR